MAWRPLAWQVLRRMRDCRPPPRGGRGRDVNAFCFDQTYEWVGMQKHGRRRTLERVDAAGMPIVIENEVYINSIKINLPETLGTLSAADRQRIAANHGSPWKKSRISNVSGR